MRRTPLALAILLLVTAVGCADMDGPVIGPGGDESNAGLLRAALTSGVTPGDVVSVRYVIVRPDDGCDAEPLAEDEVLVEAEALPTSQLPDSNGSESFAFADALFSLRPGAYLVCVTPLDEAGVPSEVCGSAQAQVNVRPRQTVETLVFSQCQGPASGQFDGATAFNFPPFIEDVVVEPSKYITVCETATISIEVSDPNGDTGFVYTWEILNGPEGATMSITGAGPSAVFATDAVGSYLVRVTVGDGRGGDTYTELPIYVSDDDCGPCAGDPCRNGGTCTPVDGVAVCDCPAPFIGDTCALMGCVGAPVSIDFSAEPTSTPTSFSRSGVYISGSSTLSILNFNGLGVLGGSDYFLDGSERLTFSFGKGAFDVRYQTNNVSNGDGDGLLGEAVVEGFDASGASAGTQAVNGLGVKEVSTFFGGQLLKSFRLTADADGQIIYSLGFTPVSQTTPTIDFSELPTQQVATYSAGGITVTGSNTLNFLYYNGLGVVGGGSDNFLNGGESVTFTMDAPAYGVAFQTNNVGNGDGDGLLGESTIEAFDAVGASLGTVAVNGLGVRDVSSLFGNVLISSFTVTAIDGDSQIIYAVWSGGGTCGQ